MKAAGNPRRNFGDSRRFRCAIGLEANIHAPFLAADLRREADHPRGPPGPPPNRVCTRTGVPRKHPAAYGQPGEDSTATPLHCAFELLYIGMMFSCRETRP